MKSVVIALLLLILSYCITETKCTKCSAKSCLDCTKYSNCVWCNGNCQSKYSEIECSGWIEAPENCTSGCDYNGRHYSVGDSFPSTDGCNNCSCMQDGSATCTLMSCTPGCVYNGKTYNEGDSFPSTDGCNQCSCTNSRVICTLRLCRACQTNNDCQSGFYCKKDSCNDTLSGSCSTRIEFCPEEPGQVCGCDGQTYASACAAASAGVNVKSNGECEGTCQSNNDCESGYYCMKNSCDSLNGSCSARIEFCPVEPNQVCGCDGETYANACAAASAGVNVKSNGNCSCQGTCQSNNDCESGYFCAKNTCGAADGTCTQKTDVCDTLYNPVCGCDNQTYSNECSAHNAGENVKFDGQCPGKQ